MVVFVVIGANHSAAVKLGQHQAPTSAVGFFGIPLEAVFLGGKIAVGNSQRKGHFTRFKKINSFCSEMLSRLSQHRLYSLVGIRRAVGYVKYVFGNLLFKITELSVGTYNAFFGIYIGDKTHDAFFASRDCGTCSY